MGLLTYWDNPDSEFGVDESDIFSLARMLNLSEYEFFCTAARRWGVRLDRAQEDFREYLWLNSVPFYVSDWIRMSRITPTSSC